MPTDTTVNGNGRIPLWAYRIATLALLGVSMFFVVRLVEKVSSLDTRMTVVQGVVEGLRADADRMEGHRVKAIEDEQREHDRRLVYLEIITKN